MDASVEDGFIPVTTIPWKVSPEEQAFRDDQARQLVAQWEPNGTDPELALKSREAPGARPFFDPHKDNPYKSDGFIPVTSTTKSEDGFIPYQPTQTGPQKAVSGAMAAVDLLAPVGSVVAGWRGIGKGLESVAQDLGSLHLPDMEKALKQAAKGVSEAPQLNPSDLLMKLGVPKEWVKNPTANIPLEKLEEASRWVGEHMQDYFGGSTIAGLVGYLGVQGTAMLLLHKTGSAGVEARPIEVLRQEKGYTPGADAVNDLIGSNVKEIPLTPNESMARNANEPTLIEENPNQGNLFTPDEAPVATGLTNPETPIWEQKPPMQEGLFDPNNVVRNDVANGRAPANAWERQQAEELAKQQNLQRHHSIWEKESLDRERTQEARDAIAREEGKEPTTPEQSNPTVEKIVEPQKVRTTLKSEEANPSPTEPGLLKISQSPEGTTIRPYLQHIIDTETNPLVKAIARVLHGVVKDVTVSLDPERMPQSAHPDQVVPGNYNMAENLLQFHPEFGLNRRTILHEAAHAAIAAFQHLKPNHPFSVALKMLHQIASPHLRLAGLEYATKNHYEFLAEALGSEKVQQILNKVSLSLTDRNTISKLLQHGGQSRLRTAWDAFKAAAGEILGYRNEHALDWTLKAASRIVDMHISDPATQKLWQGEVAMRAGRTSLNFNMLENGKTQGDIVFDKRTAKEVIQKALLNSSTLKGFETQLALFQESKQWHEDVVSRARELWANKNQILSEFARSQYDEMGATSQRQSADLRSFQQMAKESMKWDGDKLVPLTEDVPMAGTKMNAAHIEESVNAHSQGGKLLKWVFANTREILNQGSKVYKQMVAHLDNYSTLSRKDKMGVTQAAIDFDGLLNDVLTKAGLQWPTSEMLKSRGLSDAQIKAYEGWTKAADKAWDLVETIFRDNGKEPPQRIPGYFPHFWTGAWKVVVQGTDTKPMHIQPFDTELFAKRYLKEVQAKGLQAELQKPEAEVNHQSFVAAINDASQIYANKGGISAAMTRMLQSLEISSKRGIIKEALERDANATGFDAERGVQQGNMLEFRHNSRLLSSFQRYLEDVSKFYANSRIAKEVALPFIQMTGDGVLSKVPNTRKAISDFLGRATGSPTNWFSGLDEGFRRAAIAAGVPPDSVANFITGMGNTVATSALRFFNVNFLVSNILQPASNMGDLSLIHMQRILNGEKGGDIFKAMGTFFAQEADLTHNKLQPRLRAAANWAKEEGIIETYQADHLDPTKTAGPFGKLKTAAMDKPPELVEKHGRMAMFLMFYDYFKSAGLPEREALNAAANKTNYGMGNYDQVNLPSMYTDFGVTGASLKRFAVLRNTYLGKTYEAIQLITDTAQKAALDPKTAPKVLASMVPLAIFIAQGLAWSGATGVIGAAEHDAIARILNATFNPDKPFRTMDQIIRQWDAPEWVKYGTVGHWLGWDIGQSINAPNMNGLEIPPAMSGASNLAKAAYHTATGDMGKLYADVRALAPPVVKPYIEEWAAQQMNNGELMPKATNLQGGTERSKTTGSGIFGLSEDQTYKLSGKRAISEKERTLSDQIYNQSKVTDEMWRATQVQKLANLISGFNPLGLDVGEEIRKVIEADRGFDGNNLGPALDKAIMARKTSQHDRDLLELSHSTDAAAKGRNWGNMAPLIPK